jgi:putative endopeptidase
MGQDFSKLALKGVLGIAGLVNLAATDPAYTIPEKREYQENREVHACDDFHAYVCSSAEGSFKLREDRSAHIFAFDDSDERLLEIKKKFFRDIDQEKKLSRRSRQMKDYYKACMSESNSAKEESKLVAELRREVEGIKTIQDFIKLSLKNMTNEKWSFLGYDILPNIDKPTIYDITFGIDLMFLPEHSYYDNKELIEAYVQLMTEFFKEIFPSEKPEELLKRARAVAEFENRFKEHYPMPAAFRQRYTQPRYVDRSLYVEKTKVIGLEPFFKAHVPTQTRLRDFMPETVEWTVKELNSQNLQVLKDIYTFRNARGFMDDAYPELYKKRLAFSFKYLGGAPVRPERQERCTMSVMGAFNRELDLELLPRVFPNFPREKMIEVSKRIREAIVDGIEKNTWLSEQGKKGALEKIKSAKLQLISPSSDREWDFKPIQSYSSQFPYENGKKLAILGHQRTFKKLREGVNQEAWGMGPLTVNAYYSPDKNKFVMPIGILQYPFFVQEGDVTENLGAVGSVIGHELGHAIDDEGAKFNAQGQLKQWMSDEDVKMFKSKGERLIEQFNKIGHNGSLTLGENVADLVGLTFGYRAAFPNGKGSVEAKKQFFTAYARLWCGVMRDKTKERQLKTDPHSLGYARINEQMKHQPGFAEAFQCQSKHKLFLNPEERVQIW